MSFSTWAPCRAKDEIIKVILKTQSWKVSPGLANQKKNFAKGFQPLGHPYWWRHSTLDDLFWHSWMLVFTSTVDNSGGQWFIQWPCWIMAGLFRSGQGRADIQHYHQVRNVDCLWVRSILVGWGPILAGWYSCDTGCWMLNIFTITCISHMNAQCIWIIVN